MTENQLFSMSAEFFDTSSNSSNSNALKYDLFTTLGSQHSFSTPTNYLSVGNVTSSSSSSATATSGSNVMLTTAISIPRSNNPNQSHNPYQQQERTRHHLASPSPLHNMSMMASTQQHQQQQQQQQLQQQQQHQQQQHQLQQQQQQQQQQNDSCTRLMLGDLSDYGLDALDANSLSPTLLQDVSLSAASPLNSTLYNGNISIASGFYAQDAAATSPLGIMCGGNLSSTDAATLLGLSSNPNVGDANSSNPLLFEIAPNSNTMWSDISSAIVNTKNEPFPFEDDYIFPNDKAEIQAAELADLNDGDFLNDIVNIEDLLPPSSATQNVNFMLSPQPSSSGNSLQQLSNSPQASPVGPPMELLQQHQQQQQQNAALQSLLNNQQSTGSTSSTTISTTPSSSSQTQPSSSTSPYEIYHSTPNKQQHIGQLTAAGNAFSPGSQPSHSPLQLNSITPPPPPHANRSQYQQVKSRNMHELMKKGFSMSPDRSMLGQSVPGNHVLLTGNALSPGSGSSGFGSAVSGNSSTTGVVVTAGGAGGSIRKSFGYQNGGEVISSQMSRLSSSAPTHLGLDQIWMRREPRQHLLSTGSLAEAESYSSLSTGSVLSPDGIDFSQDDDDDNSSDNSDQFDDFSSDNGSDNEDDGRTSTPNHLSSSKGKERFFWQYNVQAKGPKGKRLVFQSKLEDPHVLNEVTDPVFSPNCSVRGIKVYKHSGKARKGDGNDLTPNARKLHNIGKELDKLSRTINDMTPVSELPFNVRPKSRKEKNKLASRACRLKKKAQHEANKIKLFGLEIEHKRLLNCIQELKQALAVKYRTQNLGESTEEIDAQIERIYKTANTGLCIAGGSTDFVNKVLENMKGGLHNGGLEGLRNT